MGILKPCEAAQAFSIQDAEHPTRLTAVTWPQAARWAAAATGFLH